jgi:hypothetical protein
VLIAYYLLHVLKGTSPQISFPLEMVSMDRSYRRHTYARGLTFLFQLSLNKPTSKVLKQSTLNSFLLPFLLDTSRFPVASLFSSIVAVVALDVQDGG